MIIEYLKGILVGLVIALPFGPMGLFCLETTVSRGKKAGFLCGCGMVLADIFTSAIMLLGFTLLSDFIENHQTIFECCIATIFLLIGLSIFHTRNRNATHTSTSKLIALTLYAFLLSISPATITLLICMYTALDIGADANAPAIILGAGTGSCAWVATILGAGSFISRILGKNLPQFKCTVAALMGIFSIFMFMRIIFNCLAF